MGVYPSRHGGGASAPNPREFKILKVQQFSGAHVIHAHYDGCTNFEGKKIMVFFGKYQKTDSLDPHFSQSWKSPVARFAPTELGIALAEACAKTISAFY